MLEKIIQYFCNNLWYGENSRRESRWRFEGLLQSGAVSSLLEPDYSRIWGIDTSHWDGLVDLSVTKSKGASFVFIKGIDGTLQTKYFVENRATALSVDLPHAPYGWLYADKNVSCIAQAQAYSTLINKYPPSGLLPVIDFEWTNYGGVRSDPNYSDLDKWVTEWLRLGNPKPILYSAAGYMNTFGRIPEALKAKFAGLWAANYGVNTPYVPLGYATDEWQYHQFASTGNQELLAPSSVGKKELDLNYEGKYTIPVPPTTGDDKMFKGRISTGTNIRTSYPAQNGSYTDIGDLAVNDVVYADIIHDSSGVPWWHLVDATRGGIPVKTTDGRTVKEREDTYCYGVNVTDIVEVVDPTEPPAVAISKAIIDFHDDGTLTGTWE